MKLLSYFFVIAIVNAQIGGGAKASSTGATPQVTSPPVLANTDSDPQLFVYNGSFNNCGSQVVNILLIGDSITYGYGANIPNTGGWGGRLAANLQEICPSHGTGIIPAYMPQWNQSVVDTNWNAQNGWSAISGLGPMQSGFLAFATLYQGGAGTSPAILSSQRGDTAVVYYATYTDSGTGFGVSFDGGPVQTYGASASAAYAAQGVVIPIPGGLGAHTISIVPPTEGHMYLYGVEFTIGNIGVSVHNVARPAARAEAYGADPMHQDAFWPLIGGGVQLVIDSLGASDLETWNPSNYQNYQQNLIANFQLLSNPAPSILILDENHAQNENVNNKSQLQMIELGLGLAYASVGDRWGTWANANALGLQFDSLHPDDKGYEDITAMLTARLTSGSFEPESYSLNPTLQSLTVTGAANATHVGSSGGTPTIAGGSALGVGPSTAVSIAGSDNNGLLTFNTGISNVSSGIIATITFNQAWVNTATSVVACVLQPANATSVQDATSIYISRVTTNSFTVTANASPKASAQYSYYYHCGN